MRRYSYSSGWIALAGLFAPIACSSSSGGAGATGNGVTCGPGTTLDASVCYAPATETLDASPTVDAGDAGGDGGGGPTPVSPVVFAGVTAAAPASTTSLLLAWKGASSSDALDGGGVFKYRVYLATSPGGENFAAPTAESAPGATSIVIDSGLTPNTKYYAVVRAVDAAGHEDANTAEQSATTQADITAPLFGGVTGLATAPEASLTLTWNAATDDLTPQAGIVYDVYLSTTAHGEDLNLPTAVSLPGATSVTVTGLPAASTTYYAVVRAVDAAGNVDLSPESVIEGSGKSGSDDVAPAFSGCTSATQVDAQSIAVTWASAVDNSTPAAQIAYDVFASTTVDGQDFAHPTKTFTPTGASALTGGLVDGLKSGTTYYLVCRARDLSANADQNKFVRVATTAIDSMPPTFAGVTGVRNQTPTSVDLYWSTPAADDQTPASEIVYVAYQSKTPGGEPVDAGAPVATSAPGATSMTITGLSPATKYYWVVRAEDRAGNIEPDAHETSATTLVSYTQNVVTIIASHCAVSGCHIPGSPPNGLVLTPTQAYQNLVGVVTVEASAYQRVNPGSAADSYIYLKVSSDTPPAGSRMPPPATTDALSNAEIQILYDWINQGALQN